MIRKAVVPAAGLGTRLLSVTKEQPKEMLPIFMGDALQGLSVKPFLQAVYEQLCDIGIEQFCFIVGRGKRAIEDHFTPDRRFIASLNSKGKSSLAQATLIALQRDDVKISGMKIRFLQAQDIQRTLPNTGPPTALEDLPMKRGLASSAAVCVAVSAAADILSAGRTVDPSGEFSKEALPATPT